MPGNDTYGIKNSADSNQTPSWVCTVCSGLSVPIFRTLTEVNRFMESGLEVIKLISCATQLSMKFILLINVEMPTSVGISTFMVRKNSIIGLSEPEKC